MKRKFKVGDIAYMPHIPGDGLPVIDEVTVVDVFEFTSGVFYDTNITDWISENSLFKTKKQALKVLKRDVKSLIESMKIELKILEDEIKLENN